MKDRSEDRMGSYFKSVKSKESEESSSKEVETVAVVTTSKSPYLIADEVLDAEIVWCFPW